MIGVSAQCGVKACPAKAGEIGIWGGERASTMVFEILLGWHLTLIPI